MASHNSTSNGAYSRLSRVVVGRGSARHVAGRRLLGASSGGSTMFTNTVDTIVAEYWSVENVPLRGQSCAGVH
jgi:hypothetical protein